MTKPENTSTIRLVITSGEPAGIGPDICLGLNEANIPVEKNIELYVIADAELMQQRADLLNRNVTLHIHHDTDALSANYQRGKLNIIPLALSSPCQAGTLDPDNSAYVLACSIWRTIYVCRKK